MYEILMRKSRRNCRSDLHPTLQSQENQENQLLFYSEPSGYYLRSFKCGGTVGRIMFNIGYYFGRL